MRTIFLLALLAVGATARAADSEPEPGPTPTYGLEYELPEPPERLPQPLRASAWILAEQGALFLFNGYLVRPPTWDPPRWDVFKGAWTGLPDANDDDGALMNVIMHPLMGSHFYMAARNHGHNTFEATMFTFAGAFLWEFVVESWFVRPVALDLFTTAILGVPVGMLISGVKVPIRRIDSRFLRGLALLPFDPIEGVDTWLFAGPPRPTPY